MVSGGLGVKISMREPRGLKIKPLAVALSLA